MGEWGVWGRDRDSVAYEEIGENGDAVANSDCLWGV